MSIRKLAIVCTFVLAVAALPLSAASAQVADATSTFTYTKNLHPLGYSARVVPTANATPGAASSTRPRLLGQDGRARHVCRLPADRRVRPGEPVGDHQLDRVCQRHEHRGQPGRRDRLGRPDHPVVELANPGAQHSGHHDSDSGHRSSPVHDPGAFCGDWAMFREPAAPPLPERGQEGVHVIDISDRLNPEVIGFVDTPCGSHTETLVPDPPTTVCRLQQPVIGQRVRGDPGGPTPVSCAGMDVIEVPLDDPAAASYLRFEPAGHEDEDLEEHHPCHDSAVILGDVMRLACAGVPGAAVYSLEEEDGGSLEDPMFLYNVTTGGSGIGHSASFTWDGKYLIVGHEPGGGSGARCDAGDPPVERTFFFHNIESNEVGPQVGRFVIPRLQTTTENCTTHNYNVVDRQALRDGVGQLPVGHQRGRLHGSGEREGNRLRRPGPAG